MSCCGDSPAANRNQSPLPSSEVSPAAFGDTTKTSGSCRGASSEHLTLQNQREIPRNRDSFSQRDTGREQLEINEVLSSAQPGSGSCRESSPLQAQTLLVHHLPGNSYFFFFFQPPYPKENYLYGMNRFFSRSFKGPIPINVLRTSFKNPCTIP